MAQWHVGGEIVSFDQQEHGAEALVEKEWVAVASSRPTNEIAAGLQSKITINLDRVVVAEDEAAVDGDSDLRVASGRLVQQIAYRSGLVVGHAGLYHVGHEVEPLASLETKAAVDKLASTGNLIGYLCFVRRDGFEDVSPVNGSVLSTRRVLPVQELVGVTGAVLHALLGRRGVDGLRDPAAHPVVRDQLAAAGLRGLTPDRQ